jgi:hypothetical protein
MPSYWCIYRQNSGPFFFLPVSSLSFLFHSNISSLIPVLPLLSFQSLVSHSCLSFHIPASPFSFLFLFSQSCLTDLIPVPPFSFQYLLSHSRFSFPIPVSPHSFLSLLTNSSLSSLIPVPSSFQSLLSHSCLSFHIRVPSLSAVSPFSFLFLFSRSCLISLIPVFPLSFLSLLCHPGLPLALILSESCLSPLIPFCHLSYLSTPTSSCPALCNLLPVFSATFLLTGFPAHPWLPSRIYCPLLFSHILLHSSLLYFPTLFIPAWHGGIWRSIHCCLCINCSGTS